MKKQQQKNENAVALGRRGGLATSKKMGGAPFYRKMQALSMAKRRKFDEVIVEFRNKIVPDEARQTPDEVIQAGIDYDLLPEKKQMPDEPSGVRGL